MGYKTSPTRGRRNKAILGVEKCQFSIEGLPCTFSSLPCIFNVFSADNPALYLPHCDSHAQVKTTTVSFLLFRIFQIFLVFSNYFHTMSNIGEQHGKYLPLVLNIFEHYLGSGKNPGVFPPNPQQFPSHQRCIPLLLSRHSFWKLRRRQYCIK